MLFTASLYIVNIYLLFNVFIYNADFNFASILKQCVLICMHHAQYETRWYSSGIWDTIQQS